ncbi:hypothetical protein BUALT_Bualt15G0011100 [Buddleja alternifolia]|uniref:Major facilitator superfamily (MFS) profile domain-containing protein n=1 Tax=Buddleja alternifolia TaxID=168488 RepID=A0AAV6WM72_9LAMI|nr:hypothetical protein BUALT_Bualt15G0011100 [Buddleja alternifolia]
MVVPKPPGHGATAPPPSGTGTASVGDISTTISVPDSSTSLSPSSMPPASAAAHDLLQTLLSPPLNLSPNEVVSLILTNPSRPPALLRGSTRPRAHDQCMRHLYLTMLVGGVSSMAPFLEKFFPEVHQNYEASSTNQYCKFNSQKLQLFTSSLYLAAFIASLGASWVTKKFGHRKVMVMVAFMFSLGAVLTASAVNIAMLIGGRFLIGIAIGISNQSMPMYISEMSPDKYRRKFRIFFQFMIILGIHQASLVSHFMAKLGEDWGWRFCLGFGTWPPLIMLSFFQIDTPSSLVERGKNEEAKALLKRIHGIKVDVEAKFNDMVAEMKEAQLVQNPWNNLVNKKCYRPQLAMSILIPLFQQFTGINLILFYAPVLFKIIGFKHDTYFIFATITLFAYFFATNSSIYDSDRWGRRSLSLGGGIQMLIFQVLPKNNSSSCSLINTIPIGAAVLIRWRLSVSTDIPSWFTEAVDHIAAQSVTMAVNMFAAFIMSQFFLTMLCTSNVHEAGGLGGAYLDPEEEKMNLWSTLSLDSFEYSIWSCFVCRSSTCSVWLLFASKMSIDGGFEKVTLITVAAEQGVAQSIPIYFMSLYDIPSTVCLRRTKEMNRALVAKLAWKMCEDQPLLWINLLKSKYLRGVHFLEQTETTRTSSKIWKSIMGRQKCIKKGLCFTISANGHTRTWSDPWIPTLSGFRLTHGPANDREAVQTYLVKNFIDQGTLSWDLLALNRVFQPLVVDEIVKIRIPTCVEPRRILWTPSKNAIPSGAHLHKIIPEIDPVCIMCHGEEETEEHVFIKCPAARNAWWRSKWGIRTDNFVDKNMFDLVSILLDRNNQCFPNGDFHMEFLQFAVCLMELLWKNRNNRLHGNECDPIDKIVELADKKAQDHLKVQLAKCMKKRVCEQYDAFVPMNECLIVNIDAAYKDGVMCSGVVVRDSAGNFLFATANSNSAVDARDAELQAIRDACVWLEKAPFPNIQFANDCLGAIQGIMNHQEAVDWKYEILTLDIRAFFGFKPGWSLNFICRDGGVSSMAPFLEAFFPEVHRNEASTNQYCKFNSQKLQLFTSSLYLAAFIASFFASWIIKKFGHRKTMIMVGFLFSVGAVLTSSAVNIAMLIGGRFLIGIAIGFANQSMPMYISEMSPHKYRRHFSIVFQLTITFGILQAHVFNKDSIHFSENWGWRVSLGGGVSPLLIMLSFFLKDTPSSLVERGKNEEAKALLKRIHGIKADVEAEFNDMVATMKEARLVQNPWNNLVNKECYRPQLAMSILIPLFHQFTGISVVLFYAPVLFEIIGFKHDTYFIVATITVIVYLLASTVSIYGSDRWGTRSLFIGGGIQMFIFQVHRGSNVDQVEVQGFNRYTFVVRRGRGDMHMHIHGDVSMVMGGIGVVVPKRDISSRCTESRSKCHSGSQYVRRLHHEPILSHNVLHHAVWDLHLLCILLCNDDYLRHLFHAGDEEYSKRKDDTSVERTLVLEEIYE